MPLSKCVKQKEEEWVDLWSLTEGGSMADFNSDVVVIGSGFGGSVTALRLAEKGYNVCLLERGRRYGYGEFPRHTREVKNLFWDPEDDLYGLYEANYFRKSDAYIIAGSGLGGGSLVYANVLMRMPEDFFKTWPGGITRQQLEPYYDRVIEMLEASPYPFDSNPYYRNTPKTQAIIDAFNKMPPSQDAIEPAHYIHPHLAVRFEGAFPGAQSHNKQGVLQSSCTKCGECDIGCNIHAKSTLDLTYIARASNQELLGNSGKKATVKTNALAFDIAPVEDGYKVKYRLLNNISQRDETIFTKKVVLSAGSYGSTSLLLKMKAKGNLPNLSPQLGYHWCGNGDLEGSIFKIPKDVNPSVGPVITASLAYRFQDYPEDGFPHGLYIQDGGIPAHLAWYLMGGIPSFYILKKRIKFVINFIKKQLGMDREIRIGDDVLSIIGRRDFICKAMVLLGMGRDRSTGRLFLNDSGQVELEWKMKKGSKYHFNHVRREMKKLAKEMGGRFQDNPLTYFNKVLAVHPLGGCVMAESADNGVVNVKGEAFGHPGLFVVDGSIIPSSTGVNPSLTIAAVAEMISDNL